ncbi:hypothetical protein [Streptomyces sp. NPDC048560]|uniref:hypothetical protein n=1 Tax=Streptomyces sp. NPDC048560 TaxID=3155488 RepID=UPI00341A4B57
MRQRRTNLIPELAAVLGLALAASAVWAGWLGWDQHRDVHPDGSTTGPYGAWQVIGLLLTLMVAVYWATTRRYMVGAVVGTTIGLTAAAYYDWSDDASGLFVIGVGMVMMGSFFATAVATAVIAKAKGMHRPPAATA